MTYSKQSRASAGSIVRTGLRPYFGLALLFDFSSSALSARLDNSAADVRRYNCNVGWFAADLRAQHSRLGSLVMTDVPVTCMLLFAVLGFYLWVRHRSAPFLLLTALAAV